MHDRNRTTHPAPRRGPAAAKGSAGPGLLRRSVFAASLVLAFAAVAAFLTACSSSPPNVAAISAYDQYDFASAREALRGDAYLRNDEQTILNRARLGLAALADGDLDEAERALGYVFDLLSTAGLNEDRTTAAVLTHEGSRIWKGEPFEQALMYHYVATLYAVKGDWENARAAAANSLFRLTDFGNYRDGVELARRAADDPEFLDHGYTAVDSNFTLGFLMQAIASEIAGAPGADDLYASVLAIDPGIRPLVDELRAREFDTLLIVDYGSGPEKISFGPNDSLVRFVDQARFRGLLDVALEDEHYATVDRIGDVNRMAADHRWNNLEDVRRMKSTAGDFLVGGGALTAVIGANQRSAEAALAGLGAMALGALLQSGAKADTRHLEFLPHSIYLVPLRLERPGTIRLGVQADPYGAMVLPDVEPGTTERPRAVYVRLHDQWRTPPAWLRARVPRYGNDHTGVRPGDYPWILGGSDLSTPSRAVLEAYQIYGHLEEFTLDDLKALYEAEEILLGSGAEDRPGQRRNPSFRHILEGGRGLFTPEPGSMGYKRLMFQSHPPYEPRSDRVRELAEQMRGAE